MHIAGAGMAGLVAAVRARELGLRTVVFEKGTRAGGSMLLSSCVVWRYQTFELFREECPGGDPIIQRLVYDRFDDALEWLESLDAPVVWQETGNPRTVGKRFEPVGLVQALLARVGDVRLETPLRARGEQPLVLATGGYPVRLARQRALLVRSNPWSEGDGIELARSLGAAFVGDADEFYGRNMPAPPATIREQDFVPAAQLYARWARIENEVGEEFLENAPSWSELDVVRATARQPGGTAWYVVERSALQHELRGRSVAEMIEAARVAGGEVVERDDGRIAVHVKPGVTHTIAGLRVDASARVLDEAACPIAGLYAAGVDVGGISTGGYTSGLASALVLGVVAAETIAAESP